VKSTAREWSRFKEGKNMKKILIAAAVGMLVAGSVTAQESPWLVRARAVNLNMANDVTSGLAGVNVNDKTIGEVDVSYFFNKNVAAELILTLPQTQAVYSGAAPLGSFKHLPPTLTLQYHFTDFQGFKPYVGAGLNYTKITGDSLGTLHLDNESYGAALQVGVDVPLTKQVSLNLDVKKLSIKTDVYNAAGVSQGTLKLDPTLIGVGVGYRF
jgi:outer membrane protein